MMYAILFCLLSNKDTDFFGNQQSFIWAEMGNQLFFYNFVPNKRS